MPTSSPAAETIDGAILGSAEAAVITLHDRNLARGYRGYEFDDFLASPLVGRVTRRSEFLQRAAIQLGERSPVNLRPVLGVPRLESTKARGFFARGYLELYARSMDQRWLEHAHACLDWLTVNACRSYGGFGWGNHFDFASRGGRIPRLTPTVVWTAHIAEALLLSTDVAIRQSDRDALGAAAQFVAEGLGYQETSHGVCFNYTPQLPLSVHNSNLLGAQTLLRGGSAAREAGWWEVAARSFAWSLREMNDDGSWYYGVGAKWRWIDSFHTAYVLESLIHGHEVLGEEVVPWDAVQRTYGFWLRNFFLPDGTPRYYHDRTYPIDIQCAAQAIETMSRHAERFPGTAPVLERVVGWTLNNMRRGNGAFRYQRHRRYVNNLESIHWGQATMFSALATLLRNFG